MNTPQAIKTVVVLLLLVVQFASPRFLVSYSLLKVVYGRLGRLRELGLPPRPPADTRRALPERTDFTEHAQIPEFQEYADELKQFPLNHKMSSPTDIDIQDFNEASKGLTDIKNNLQEVMRAQVPETRRQKMTLPPSEILALVEEPVKLREWYYQKLALTFLIHIRYQGLFLSTVDMVFRAAIGLRGYKIGYLFHRLVNLKNKMLRLVGEVTTFRTQRLIQNRPNWRTKKHNLALLLRYFERVQQLDVDIKDTAEMIKLIWYGRPLFQQEQFTVSTPPYNV